MSKLNKGKIIKLELLNDSPKVKSAEEQQIEKIGLKKQRVIEKMMQGIEEFFGSKNE